MKSQSCPKMALHTLHVSLWQQNAGSYPHVPHVSLGLLATENFPHLLLCVEHAWISGALNFANMSTCNLACVKNTALKCKKMVAPSPRGKDGGTSTWHHKHSLISCMYVLRKGCDGCFPIFHGWICLTVIIFSPSQARNHCDATAGWMHRQCTYLSGNSDKVDTQFWTSHLKQYYASMHEQRDTDTWASWMLCPVP